MTQLVSVTPAQPETIRTYELWQQINTLRVQAGERKIRHDDFLARVEDELEDELGVCEIFAHPQNHQEMRGYQLNRDQAVQVGNRESKVVRKQTRFWLNELMTMVQQPKELSRKELLVMALEAEEENEKLRLEVEQTNMQLDVMTEAMMTERDRANIKAQDATYLRNRPVYTYGDVSARAIRTTTSIANEMAHKYFGGDKRCSAARLHKVAISEKLAYPLEVHKGKFQVQEEFYDLGLGMSVKGAIIWSDLAVDNQRLVNGMGRALSN